MTGPRAAGHPKRREIMEAHPIGTRKSIPRDASERLERLLDHCLENTFPASDPISALSTHEPWEL